MRKFLIAGLILIFSISLKGQKAQVGQWIDYSSYGRVHSVADNNTKTYGVTDFSLLEWDKSDNSIQVYKKGSGLSSVGITKIHHNETTNKFILGYKDGNLDIVDGNKITNIPSLFNKKNITGKRVNDFLSVGKYVFVGCDFGLLKFDINSENVEETIWLKKDNQNVKVRDIELIEDTLYAATDEGILKCRADLEDIAYYKNWSLINGIRNQFGSFELIGKYKDSLVINYPGEGIDSDSVYFYKNNTFTLKEILSVGKNVGFVETPNLFLQIQKGNVDFFDSSWTNTRRIYTYNRYENDASTPLDVSFVSDKEVWIGDEVKGMIKSTDVWKFNVMNLGGPPTQNVVNMDSSKDRLYIATGTRNGFTPTYSNEGINIQKSDKSWMNYNVFNKPEFNNALDFVSIARGENDQEYFVASFGTGVLHFKNDKLVEIYDDENAGLPKVAGIDGDVRSTDVKLDGEGNLWVVNTGSTNLLSKRVKSTGKWIHYSMDNNISPSVPIGGLMIDKNGTKWVNTFNDGIVVFNDNGTPENFEDDYVRRLQSGINNGNLSSNSVLCVEEDKDGEVWVGTAKGVVVYYNTDNIFLSESGSDAQKVIVEFAGYSQYLLESQEVSAIAIDGANRKWFGTTGSGVYLVSEDGTKQLAHFTKKNSQLYENNIEMLYYREETGELFIGTSLGLQAYKTTSVAPESDMSNVFAFPNPVEPNYNGLISIKGLAFNSSVKITDLVGNLVFETISEGGLATWNGLDLNGEKPKPGVYLVFAADEEGKEKQVTKILMVN